MIARYSLANCVLMCHYRHPQPDQKHSPATKTGISSNSKKIDSTKLSRNGNADFVGIRGSNFKNHVYLVIFLKVTLAWSSLPVNATPPTNRREKASMSKWPAYFSQLSCVWICPNFPGGVYVLMPAFVTCEAIMLINVADGSTSKFIQSNSAGP